MYTQVPSEDALTEETLKNTIKPQSLSKVAATSALQMGTLQLPLRICVM